MDKYIEKILAARVYDVACETPLDLASTLSRRLDNTVLLKREDLQPVFSFKLRGAYNKIFHAVQENPNLPGIIASSAGNHAQGVALVAQKLGLKAIIVMPRTTPQIKVDAVKSWGARAVLHGDAYDDAYAHARELEKEKGYVFIHPFDDPYTIAGQGTIGMEICRQCRDGLDAIFVPIGGGGLIAGIAAFIKYLRPEVKIIGVEPEDADAMYQSIAKNRRVKLSQVGIFADGVAVKQVGKETFKLVKKYVDEIVLVSVDEICAAVKDIFDDTRSMMEPAGALGVAGLKKYVEARDVKGQTLIAINSGANINFDRLRHVAERAEIGEHREALLAVTIPERPGSFRKFCQALGKRGITEFNYRYSDSHDANIFVGVQLSGGEEERKEVITLLEKSAYPVIDMTDNEMAKLHTRYMVGGRAQNICDERIFRFQFPERPGALTNFLNKLNKERAGHGWNISLFHYRNHGAAYGRILMGVQVPDKDKAIFHAFLKDVDFPFIEETSNAAYKAFLA